MQWFTVRRQLGAIQVAGFHTIYGESLVVRVQWPGGGLVWNTPIALHVQRRGHVATHWIVDVTRLAQWALAIVSVMALLQLGRRQKEATNGRYEQ